MKNINNLVWKKIDNNPAIQKLLIEKLINISALARKIIQEEKLLGHTDAVISAIRRYEHDEHRKQMRQDFSLYFEKAKCATKTKLASLLLKKNEKIREKLAELFPLIDFEGNDTLRIFEVTKYIKVILDEENLEKVKKTFDTKECIEIQHNISEIAINYKENITKVPGLFAYLAHEYALKEISIIDSIICHNEHILIIQEKDLESAIGLTIRLIKNSEDSRFKK